MEKIEILTTIFFVCIMGSINSLLSYFLDYCFWEGSIFGSYLPWLAKWNMKIFKPTKYLSLNSAKNNPEYSNMLVQSASDIALFKMLGGCSICSNIWLGFFTFVPIALFIGVSFWYIIPYLLFSSFILRKMLNV